MSLAQPAPRPEKRVEELLDGYLIELARNGTADLDVWAAQLARGDLRERFRREALAEEFAWRSARGEAVVLEVFAARLPQESDRKVFAQLVRANRLAERSLPPQYAPGSVLGDRYRIRSILGRGGMSVVFAAWDQELEREVAIKVFNAQAQAGSADEWEGIAHGEAAALARLDHPNVVHVHDIRRDKAHTYIVMDRVAGIDLSSALEELQRAEAEDAADPARRPTRLCVLLEKSCPESAESAPRPTTDRIDARSWPRTVARILAPVAAGIESAHQLGQVHRDLKPNNVLLRAGADPVVLDFGLAARVRPGGDDSGVLRGTPEYFAPEQARDLKSGSDVRTDVYQLGLVLYEMLELDRAQSREKTEDILRFLARVSLGPSERVEALPNSIPRGLRAICAKALAAKVAERYASAGAMAEDLERFAAGLPNVHAKTSGAHAAWQRAQWLVKKPAFAGLVVGGVALAVGTWMRVEAAGRWIPPSITPFHFADGATGLASIDRSQGELRIAPAGTEQFLGATIDASSPAFVYSLGVTGNGDGKLAVYPQKPHVLNGPENEHWAFEIREPGSVQLEAYRFNGEDSEEGILILARRDRSEPIESWLASLWAQYEKTKQPIPYDRAMSEFDVLASTTMRGLATPKSKSTESDRDMFRNFATETAVTERMSKAKDMKWFQQILRVRREKE